MYIYRRGGVYEGNIGRGRIPKGSGTPRGEHEEVRLGGIRMRCRDTGGGVWIPEEVRDTGGGACRRRAGHQIRRGVGMPEGGTGRRTGGACHEWGWARVDPSSIHGSNPPLSCSVWFAPARAAAGLAFARYCHYQYCMVYGIQTRGQGGGRILRIRRAIVLQ